MCSYRYTQDGIPADQAPALAAAVAAIASMGEDWQASQAVSYTHLNRNIEINNMDALQVMSRYDTPDTLHYVDPPYVLSLIHI